MDRHNLYLVYYKLILWVKTRSTDGRILLRRSTHYIIPFLSYCLGTPLPPLLPVFFLIHLILFIYFFSPVSVKSLIFPSTSYLRVFQLEHIFFENTSYTSSELRLYFVLISFMLNFSSNYFTSLGLFMISIDIRACVHFHDFGSSIDPANWFLQIR